MWGTAVPFLLVRIPCCYVQRLKFTLLTAPRISIHPFVRSTTCALYLYDACFAFFVSLMSDERNQLAAPAPSPSPLPLQPPTPCAVPPSTNMSCNSCTSATSSTSSGRSHMSSPHSVAPLHSPMATSPLRLDGRSDGQASHTFPYVGWCVLLYQHSATETDTSNRSKSRIKNIECSRCNAFCEFAYRGPEEFAVYCEQCWDERRQQARSRQTPTQSASSPASQSSKPLVPPQQDSH